MRWFVLFVSVEIAVLSAAHAWFLRWRRRHPPRDAPGCQICGYDLTGNASGVCPECGTMCPPAGGR